MEKETNLKNMKYIVYQTTNIINNKIYIGVHKTENPDVFDGYIGCGIKINIPSSYMYPTTPLLYAVKKYGPESFKRTILALYNNPEEAYALEKTIVNSSFICRKDTYNAKLGGLGGCSYYTALNQFDLNGNFIKHWNSIIEAAEFLGVSHTAILSAYKFKESCKSFLWAKEDTINIENFNFTNHLIIYKYDENGNYLGCYNSIAHASRENNTQPLNIRRAVDGGYKISNNYYANNFYETYTGKNKISIKNKIVYIYDLDGNYVTELKSKDLYEFLNINTLASVTKALRTNKPYKQYLFNLTKVDKMNKVTNVKSTPVIIECYTRSGDLVKTFKSISEAVSEYGTGVQRVLKGLQSHCKNFIFKKLMILSDLHSDMQLT